MKKKNYLIFIFLIIIGFWLVFLNTLKDLSATNIDEQYFIDNFSNLINEELEKNATDVISELYNQLEYYEELLKNGNISSNEYENIQNLINSTKQMIDEYQIYNIQAPNSSFKDIILPPLPDPLDIHKRAVIEAVAYFKLMGYNLSAELLIHARSNSVWGSEYSPTHSRIILNSSAITNNIAYGNLNSGTIKLQNSGNKYEKDLYFALRHFGYEKHYYNDISININIRDLYDFEYNDDFSILGMAINTMVLAQAYGVIKPFFVNIKEIIPGTVQFMYRFENGEAIITGAPNYVQELTIPSELINLATYTDKNSLRESPVKYIGDSAFENWAGYKINIPNTVIKIGNNSFANTSLNNYIIPESVKNIGKDAFLDSAIWKNSPNNSIVYVDNWAVGYKGIINGINLNYNTVGIADYAFTNFNITELIIPDSVIAIGYGAFQNCSNLRSITLPFIGGIKDTVYYNSFHFGYIFGATDSANNNLFVPSTLQEVYITGGNNIVGTAFNDCENILLISIPASITVISVDSFMGCSNLEKIEVDESNQRYFSQDGILLKRPISNYEKLEILHVPQAIKGNVVLPYGIESIYYNFKNCNDLISLEIPNSVTYIVLGAFQGCNNLKSITLPIVGSKYTYTNFGGIFGTNNINNQNEYIPSSLKEVIINGGSEIVDSSFKNCENISIIQIPSSVTKIGIGAFENCPKLQTVIFGGITILSDNLFDEPIRFIVKSCALEKYYEQYMNILCDRIDCSCAFLMKIETSSLFSMQGSIINGEINIGDRINVFSYNNFRLYGSVSIAGIIVNNQEVNSAKAGDNIIISFGLNNLQFQSTYATKCDNLEEKIVELKISDYGFPQQYYFDELTSSYELADLIINTKRLRTGYIEKEYIVLSPRRTNAGIAYLEYSFSKPIKFITVDIALWSASENLKVSDCTAVFQYKDKNGNWITKLDLLNDIELTTDRANPNTYTILFNEPVTEYRFYLTSPATGSSNSGRLCIGNMNINYL